MILCRVHIALNETIKRGCLHSNKLTLELEKHLLVSLIVDVSASYKKQLRSSRPEVFCKKGVLRNFAKLTGKHLCQSFFFNKAATLLKKRLWLRCFPVNFAKFLRAPFS